MDRTYQQVKSTMNGTIKTDEDIPPPPPYDNHYSNGGIDNLGVRYAPSDDIQKPETKDIKDDKDDDSKKYKNILVFMIIGVLMQLLNFMRQSQSVVICESSIKMLCSTQSIVIIHE
ncbi:hypothetical protein AC249_AIPGENE4723 [Exaiptasia diaphana]|nr:hypothetical protein AC249_AIPGENE4723 [Exaiptasia diaphana]